MSKNIVICSDGTGNVAIKGRGTNVFKLFEAIDLHGHRTDPSKDPQIAFYDDGVGTEDFKPLKLLGGAAGWGLSANVKQLYKELARVYDPGDRIFLFGFSRGAFTARTLAGMIVRCGILNGSVQPTTAALAAAVHETYTAYRVLGGYDSHLTRLFGKLLGPRDPEVVFATLHRDFAFHPPADIEFMGVWDTVDAVGLPVVGDQFNRWIYQFKFGTATLSPRVKRACQALAIDEERTAFAPVLWASGAPGAPEQDDERIEQVWFAGVHSNVGGGYPKQGMSLVALEWMLRHAAQAGLRVQALDLALFQSHASADDKLYDPRAGTGIFYRWAPRDIDWLCRDKGVRPKVHLSAVERVAHGTDDYAPGNLPLGAVVVTTPTGDPDADDASQVRAEAAQKLLNQACAGRRRLLDQVKRHVFFGDVSYWLFLLSWIALLGGALAATVWGGTARPSVTTVITSTATFIGDLVALRFGSLAGSACALLATPWRWGLAVVLAGFAGAWYLSSRSDRRMSAVFSGFWHDHRQALRASLKLARKAAQAAKDGWS